MTQTKEQLKNYVVEEVKFSVECGACGLKYGHDEEVMGERPTIEQFAAEILEMGWREMDSEEYGAIMIYCPDCAEDAGAKAVEIQK